MASYSSNVDGAHEERAKPLPDGSVCEGAGEEALTNASGAEQQQVVM